jgi:hypothetical protein
MRGDGVNLSVLIINLSAYQKPIIVINVGQKH